MSPTGKQSYLNVFFSLFFVCNYNLERHFGSLQHCGPHRQRRCERLLHCGPHHERKWSSNFGCLFEEGIFITIQCLDHSSSNWIKYFWWALTTSMWTCTESWMLSRQSRCVADMEDACATTVWSLNRGGFEPTCVPHCTKQAASVRGSSQWNLMK